MKVNALGALAAFFLVSCSISKKIERTAQQYVIRDPSLQNAHVGISIFDPANNQYWYNYQGDKYFVPASNTKLPTCYAALKYLGDSLKGLNVVEYENKLELFPTGDPTFLHPDFKRQPVFDFLTKTRKALLPSDRQVWKENAWGPGWSWSDYDADYMPERSSFPIYGNVVRFWGTNEQLNYLPKRVVNNGMMPSVSSRFGLKGYVDQVQRNFRGNTFNLTANGTRPRQIEVPFITSVELAFQLLADTIKKAVGFPNAERDVLAHDETMPKVSYSVHSQPTDSMLRIMMHRSDNFFAEQSLLMVSNEKLGFMNDARIIDTLLKTDISDLPQKPRWVDGSGLSRFNLFTPQDMVTILNKMKNEFGLERIKNILATGNTGTLTNYYVKDSGYLFAKTGTLSGVVAISGYLYTKKNKLLLFSVLVNNHQGSATQVRRAVERFIQDLRERY